MPNYKSTLHFAGSTSLALVLVACSGGPQFASLFEKVSRSAPAKDTIAQARSTGAEGSAYSQALYRAELENAEFEYDQMNDYGATLFHGERAIAAASGAPLAPQTTDERTLPAEKSDELRAARTRLIAKLDTDVIDRLPQEAAQAHASYNCWLEQQEENLQPDDIARCRERFELAMEFLEQAPEVDPAMAEDKSDRAEPDYRIAGDGLFNFDEASITATFASLLIDIADDIKTEAPERVVVVAHTDDVGSEDYNLALSQRRADAVADFLGEQGINPAMIEATGVGESQPIDTNETAIGRSFNRRAEIYFQ